MTAGQQFVKALKPVGCAIFLIVFVLFLVYAFTAKAPLEGYVIPETTEYYRTHLDEFQTELEENLFPRINGVCESHIDGDRLVITIDSEYYDESTKIITHYYGSTILITEKSET